jgi:hypothetical protein
MTILYFVPDWDDRVDPDYDFLQDMHRTGRDPYRDDRYAHEIYDMPPYDGILLSRATLDDSKSKHDAILQAGSVHRYLRLPSDGQHKVLGDCGAFSYWQKEEPPYRTDDVLAYYQDLGFDFGVSIDHLIFAEVDAERERRWNITINNAEEFLKQHRSSGYTFTPVGVAQGWDPSSYQQAARALVRMGYTHIAVGGLVRSRTEDILRVLAAIKEELPSSMQFHLFGVNRPEYASQFAALGVTSFDSASRLRRAWMDGRRNYFLQDSSYTAIRIPEAQALAKKLKEEAEKKGEKPRLDIHEAMRLEKDALQALRALDKGEVTIEEAHAEVAAYAEPAGDKQQRIDQDYLRTLTERPWKNCPCVICQTIGIEVIIFRGNNRNRRRGFHNIWQLYRQLHAPITPVEPHVPITPVEPDVTMVQLELGF